MQNDLIERWGFEWKGHDHGTHARMADGYWTPWHIANDRIAALEAKLAEKDALLRECGGALSFYAREQSWRSAGMHMCGHSPDSTAVIDGGKRARTTLAKIKDATDAD